MCVCVCTRSFTAKNATVLIESATNSVCNMLAVSEASYVPPSPSRAPVALVAGVAGGAAAVVLAAVVCVCCKRRTAAGSSYAQLAADPINRA